MADIFDEVNADLRAERARAAALRYGAVAVVAAVAILVGVGVWQWRAHEAKAAAGRYASLYLQAGDLATQPGATEADRQRAAAMFAEVAARGPAGYATLARLQQAALLARRGDLPGALGLWAATTDDTRAPMTIRELASLLWVQHQLDDGPIPALRERLLPLLTPADPWRPLAEESEALLDLRRGDDQGARRVLAALSSDGAAPDGVRGRAGGLLQTLGGPMPAEPAKAAAR